MNFSKLLAAGRSIINSGGSVRYRENKSVYLPKFESDKNPFAKTVPPAAPVAVPAQVPPSVSPVTPAKMSVPVSGPSRPVPATRPAPWTGNLNPLSLFRGEKPSSVRPVKAEQTELSLDTVRVVANDLSDADVDAVPPLKSRPVRKKSEPETKAEWSEVGTGVLGVNLV